MANICPTPIHICRIRVTRLVEGTGVVAAAPNNHVVSDKPMVLGITPEIEQGEDKTLIGGCDCVAVAYKGRDKLKRFNLELTMTAWEPALVEILTGSAVLTNASSENIGNSWTDQNSCSAALNAPVAVEAWQDLWVGDAQVSNPRYVRWVFPYSYFQVSDWSLENDWATPKFAGYTRKNPNAWANPYVDFPTGLTTLPGQGGYFWDNAVPAAYCGYSTTST